MQSVNFNSPRVEHYEKIPLLSSKRPHPMRLEFSGRRRKHGFSSIKIRDEIHSGTINLLPMRKKISFQSHVADEKKNALDIEETSSVSSNSERNFKKANMADQSDFLEKFIPSLANTLKKQASIRTNDSILNQIHFADGSTHQYKAPIEVKEEHFEENIKE